MAGLRCGSACGLALVASFVLPAALAAHGGDSEFVRVAALDEQGAPWLLQLDAGLAQRSEQGWQFVCPAALEASTILHAVAADARTAWVVTLRGLHRLSRDGVLTQATSVCRGYPLELVRHRERAYLLTQDSAESEYVVCSLEASGARELYATQTPLADLASDGQQLWLMRQPAAVEDSSLELARLVDDERLGPWQSYPLAPGTRAVRLLAAGGELYATLIESGRHTLVRLVEQRVERLLDSATVIAGPVDSEGGVYALAESGLFALAPGAERVETTLPIDGLGGIDGHGFAFSRGAMYDLPVSPVGEAIVVLDGVAPPALAPLESEACEVQWRGFELGLHGVDHAEPQPTPAAEPTEQPSDAGTPADAALSRESTADGGCSVGRARATSTSAPRGLAGMLLAALALRRRSNISAQLRRKEARR